VTLLVSHTVGRELDVAVQRVFDVVVAADVLPRVLHRWGPLPAVVGTREQTGPWDTPGSRRTVLLGDGSSVRERVLRWERPRLFEYRVDRFTNPLGRLADYALGCWVFSATERGAAFRWTYAFHARGRLARAPLALFVHTAWAGYMERCATRCAALALAAD
jgi:Polyketide cyclase / dehydrase and lipid transport